MRVLTAGGLGVLLACGSPPGHAATGLQADADSARGLMERIPAILAAEGPVGWGAAFDPGPSFHMATEGRLVFPSRAVADSALAELATRFRGMSLQWTGLELEPLAPGIVSVRTGFTEAITDTGGGVLHFDGYLTALAARGDSGWRLRQLHWSLRREAPPDSAAPAAGQQ